MAIAAGIESGSGGSLQRRTSRTHCSTSGSKPTNGPRLQLGSDLTIETALLRIRVRDAPARRGPQRSEDTRRQAGRSPDLVYRHQLRPVIQTGATVMDRLFAPGSGSASQAISQATAARLLRRSE